MRYVVYGRFGGLIKFTDDLKEAEKCANETFGIVYDTRNIPHDLEYDPVNYMYEEQLEDMLNSYFPRFRITVEERW